MTYWKATLKDGSEKTENDSKWSEVKDNIQTLSLVLDSGQEITLPRADSYIQAKSASADIGSSDVTIISRYIGFKLGNNTRIL